MTTIAGVDACPAGWMCLFEELPSRRIGSKIFSTINDLFASAPEVRVLAIDIPIGFTEAGPRACDVAARKMLGAKRASSVFPAPIRPTLSASSYPDACEISFLAQLKKLSKQAWAIYPKIREVDNLLRERPDLRDRIYEVHPEVSLAAWRGTPIVESKKSAGGSAIRQALVRAHFGHDAYESVRTRYRRKEAADDDIVDAFSALWTAERIARNAAETLPIRPPIDSAGLPIRIVY